MASVISKASLKHPEGSGHAVARTAELLSCARTALKIAKAQNPPPSPQDWWYVEPSQLELHQENEEQGQQQHHYPQISILTEDGLTLLRTMHLSLETLQALVKRRGNVNDPTQEIATCTQQLEADAKELNSIVEQLKSFRSLTSQHQKHLILLAEWLQSTASHQTAQLKEILKVRGTVLADQAQRRKLWNIKQQPQQNQQPLKAIGSSSDTQKAIHESPLFTMTHNSTSKANGARTLSAGNNQHQLVPARHSSLSLHGTSSGDSPGLRPTVGFTASAPSSSSNSLGGYGASSGYGGYYGAASGVSNTMGMRQRRSNVVNNSSNNNNNNTSSVAYDDAAMVQEEVKIRHEKRQTQTRLEHAKQAEKSLAELSTLFSKMSNLIVAQGETLEKIEDDVEAAHMDVRAGQDEIQILYSLKKGNRALILKTFAVVIFVILFMRLY